MKDDCIVIERLDDGIVHLDMRDQEGRNALSAPFVALLERRLAEIASEPTVKVCVLRGLDDVFCAGGDKAMLQALSRGEVAPVDILLSRTVLELDVVTIAVMAGHAVGGGLTLGLCCDLVLMARESRYGCSFMNMGFTPGMGTTSLLELAVGPYVAAEMIMTGKNYRGHELAGRSGINGVLPKHELDARAHDLATRIAEKPRYALELAKRQLALPKRLAFERARTAEAAMHAICFGRDETRELIESHFIEP
jgi:4-carboxy-3-alkylbut-2-enoyl-[acp] decarboxylase